MSVELADKLADKDFLSDYHVETDRYVLVRGSVLDKKGNYRIDKLTGEYVEVLKGKEIIFLNRYYCAAFEDCVVVSIEDKAYWINLETLEEKRLSATIQSSSYSFNPALSAKYYVSCASGYNELQITDLIENKTFFVLTEEREKERRCESAVVIEDYLYYIKNDGTLVEFNIPETRKERAYILDEPSGSKELVILDDNVYIYNKFSSPCTIFKVNLKDPEITVQKMKSFNYDDIAGSVKFSRNGYLLFVQDKITFPVYAYSFTTNQLIHLANGCKRSYVKKGLFSKQKTDDHVGSFEMIGDCVYYNDSVWGNGDIKCTTYRVNLKDMLVTVIL